MKDVRFAVGADVHAVTVLANTEHVRAALPRAAQTDTLRLGRGGPANTPCIFDGQTPLYRGRDPPFVPPR